MQKKNTKAITDLCFIIGKQNALQHQEQLNLNRINNLLRLNVGKRATYLIKTSLGLDTLLSPYVSVLSLNYEQKNKVCEFL